MSGRRFMTFCRGILAMLVLTATTVGLPIALYKVGGSPIPARLPAMHQVVFTLLHKDNGTGLFLAAVRDVSWLAWLAFAIAVVAEAQAAIRGRRAPRLHLVGLQGVAARLVALAALTFSAPVVVSLAASPAMAATVQSASPSAHSDPVAHAHAHDHGDHRVAKSDREIVVRSGDCLWTIAEHYLGAGDRFTEIVQLNQGHEMGDGEVFSDPSLVMPGWHLRLPDATGHSGHGHGSNGQHGSSGQHGSGDGQHGSGNGQHGSGGEHGGHPSTHHRFSHPHPSAAPSAPATAPSVPAPGQGSSQPASGSGTQAAGGSDSQSNSTDHRDQLAEAALFTLGMLAGASLASIDRLRHRQRQARRPGRRIALPADPAGRRIEQKLRAAAARWPVDRTGSMDDDDEGSLADYFPDYDSHVNQFDEPEQYPLDEPEPLDLPPLGQSLAHADNEDVQDSEYLEPPGLPAMSDFPIDSIGRSESQGNSNGHDPSSHDPAYEPDHEPDHEPLAGEKAAPSSLRDALRDLSEGIAVAGEPLPPIVGIHLTPSTLDVLLSAPATTPPPAPFVIAPARQAMCWTVNLTGASEHATVAPPAPGEVGDLLPGLFTAGATQAGGYLLLDLEAMRVTCCDGPSELTDRLLVTAATELASSHWSGWYDLVLAGCSELDVLGRAEHCADLEEALALLEHRARVIERRMDDDGPPDVRTRRMADPDDEDWGLTLLVSRQQPTSEQMSRLLDLADGPGGIAALVAGDTQTSDGKLAPALFQLGPDPDRPDEVVATITLAYLGPQHQITVWPQTLTAIEYEALAGVFATAAETADVSPDDEPYSDFGAPPWIRLAAAPVAPNGPEDAEPPAPEMPVAAPIPTYPTGHTHALTSSAGTSSAGTSSAGISSAGTPGTGPRHAAPSLQLKVLGTVEILGAAEQLLPKQAELLLALALHAPAGVSSSGLCTLLGPDADHPRPADSVRQLITRTRKRLGQARDGQEFIIHLGSGIYVPHQDLSMDWTSFSALARSGRADRRREDLRAAMALVRGEPFADCYHWWIDIGLIETIRAEIIDVAELLAQLELTAGDPIASVRAARAGLAAESAAEQLWRALMRAEYEAGNFDGVNAAWTGCLDAIAEIAPGGEPHPDTERLFHQLTRGAPIGLRR